MPDNKPVSDNAAPTVIENPWRRLREYTDARIGLGRAGISLPTRELLEFQLAHARARDAVHFPLDVAALVDELKPILAPKLPGDPIVLHSEAEDRYTYLQRPDLGRVLSDEAQEQLSAVADRDKGFDLALVVVDGLSSSAVQSNAVPFLTAFLQALEQDERDWTLAPVTVVEQGRVAIGDVIGASLKARAVAVLIGERPGLSAPDSLGIYLTWAPGPAMTDANRNCISNVRPAGLGFEQASQRLLYLLHEAHRLKLSGVGLKDRTEEVVVDNTQTNRNFLAN
ncbi:ethanolamine ammonia-lyase subunit EutC [Marinobacter fonticola]|uniref:ethanolamine ammonia-lyase subunit EutC n=1 Tax=Marinobacter fonticola TaxID=2603215 RepID=UPI0011E6ABDF|nr:ethanolamine ammonia-lyase subunit EutC [Marinobacter fonticola]